MLLGLKFTAIRLSPRKSALLNELDEVEKISDTEAFASSAQESTTIVVLFLFLHRARGALTHLIFAT